jgi:hypothetical protein
MNRRAFLSLLAAAGAGATFDPERLLWVPKPIITVPAMPKRLTFHKDAFARVMAPLKVGDIVMIKGELRSYVVTADVQSETGPLFEPYTNQARLSGRLWSLQ